MSPACRDAGSAFKAKPDDCRNMKAAGGEERRGGAADNSCHLCSRNLSTVAFQMYFSAVWSDELCKAGPFGRTL